MKKSLLEGLNDRQKEAVITKDGPLLILAGPGSGKTRTLTARIASLLEEGIPGERILALTFTNKAAGEMRERIESLLKDHPGRGSGLFIGTFHSLCLRILRVHARKVGYLEHFTIFDDDDVMSVIKEVMKEENINAKQFPAGMIRNIISGLKNELTGADAYQEEAGAGDLFPRTVGRIYRAYETRLKESNGMDFDDLLMKTVHLFKTHPDILRIYQERFLYIHVDEYQDTNHAQYILIRDLAGLHQNIAVVGDDAQAIYGFRGADFRNILNFEKDWPDARVIVLDENYRSTQTILDAARGVISKNSLQKEKDLWTQKGKGEEISLYASEDEMGEARFVADTVERALREGKRVSDIAVLYRTNAQSRALEEEFLERNLPYAIIGGIRFYERKEIKDILAYLRVLQNTDDVISLKRIINTPPRGIGKTSFLLYISRKTKPERTSEKRERALDEFDTLIAHLRDEAKKRTPKEFITYLVKKIHYREYLEDGTTNADERWENIEEFVSLASRYSELGPEKGLEKLLEDVALVTESEREDAPKESIKLMTMHAAKGLEFPIVFIVGLEEGIFPHSKSLFSPKDLEEERRLCYVGITRAKEKVYLSFALRRSRFGGIEINPPSRFLSEIPDTLIDVKEENLEEVTID